MIGQVSIFDITMPMISIGNKIRLIELFAGYGSQAMALDVIGADYEHYKVVEFDKYAVQSYNAVHNTNFEPTDIRNVHGKDLEICNTDQFTYMLTYSFPCFTGDTLVMTKDGLREIKDISVGDEVITHTKEYKKVVRKMNNGNKEIYSVKGMGFDEIRCTENHRFYVRELKRRYPRKPDGKRTNIRYFDVPKWIECRNMTSKSYVGTPINTESMLPEWDGIDFEWKDGRKTRHKNELSKLMNNHSFWWIMGRYLGDGWARSQGGIIICCDKRELTEITVHLRNCEINHSVTEERTVHKIHIPLKEMELFCKQFGIGAYNKRIPGFVYRMPCDLLRSFIDGYVSADGYVGKDCVYKISTISKELAYGVAQCIAKAYKVPFRIYKTKRKSTCVIEGRVCNQKDSFQVVWKLKKKRQDKAFYEDGYIWFPISNIEKTEEKECVYDIEVDEDHSFTANGSIVHNCTDLSVAGKMQGMKKGSGTRSGLLWEVERILTEIYESGGELPQVLFMENVPQVISSANIKDFHLWQDFLTSLGYTSHVEVLNAKNYGVAQNRERCFMFSFLGEYNYKFPESIPLKKTMKDYLENEVDEKYYINSEKANKLITQLIDNGDLQGCIGNVNPSGNGLNGNVYAGDIVPTLTTNKGEGQKICVDLSIKNPSENNVANCITSRENRGISNQQSVGNGVIVAMRGRNPDNPSDRTTGTPTEQRLEPNSQGLCNTITSVQKDNLVLEKNVENERFFAQAIETFENNDCKDGDIIDAYNRKVNTSGICPTITTRPEGFKTAILPVVRIKQATKDGYIDCKIGGVADLSFPDSKTRRGRVQDNGDTCPTITAGETEICRIESRYRIRKLTPRECGRLMAVSDENINKILSVVSNSQAYKQFGNSIVVLVMVAMFSNLNIQGLPRWNEIKDRY